MSRKYLYKKLNPWEYCRQRVNAYHPGIPKPTSAELYTELHRIKEGYYAYEVESVRNNQHSTDEIDHIGFHYFQNQAYKKFPTGLLCVELLHANCMDYMVQMSVQDKAFTLNDLRGDMTDPKGRSIVVGSYINATNNGCIFIFRVDPDKHEQSYYGLAHTIFKKYKAKLQPYTGQWQHFPVSYDPDTIINKWDKVPVCNWDKEYQGYLVSLREAMSAEERNIRDSFDKAMGEDKIYPVYYQKPGFKPNKKRLGYWFASIDNPEDGRYKKYRKNKLNTKS